MFFGKYLFYAVIKCGYLILIKNTSIIKIEIFQRKTVIEDIRSNQIKPKNFDFQDSRRLLPMNESNES